MLRIPPTGLPHSALKEEECRRQLDITWLTDTNDVPICIWREREEEEWKGEGVEGRRGNWEKGKKEEIWLRCKSNQSIKETNKQTKTQNQSSNNNNKKMKDHLGRFFSFDEHAVSFSISFDLLWFEVYIFIY